MSHNITQDKVDEAKEAFKLADKDNSGSIKSKEVPMVMRALGLDPSDDDTFYLMLHKKIQYFRKQMIGLVNTLFDIAQKNTILAFT